MGKRPFAVDLHPKRKEIRNRLARGDYLLTISKKYGITCKALKNYLENRMPQALARKAEQSIVSAQKSYKVAERKAITDAQELFDIILKAVQRMETLSDSCDEYLQDPDNPGNYYMGPRAHDVQVIYYIKGANGKPTKVKKSLQEIIGQMEKHGIVDPQIKSNDTDPRVLLVKASETLTKQMDTLVNAWQAVDQGRNAFVGTPAWDQLVKIILEATKNSPEVRRRIADGISQLDG
jgi:hypothetical protein